MKIKFTFNDEGENFRDAVYNYISDPSKTEIIINKNKDLVMKLFDKISDPSVSDSNIQKYPLMGEFSDYVSEVMKEVSISEYVVFKDYIFGLKKVVKNIVEDNPKLADDSKFIQSKLNIIDKKINLTFNNPGQADAIAFKTNLSFILKNLKKIDSIKGKLSSLRKYYLDKYNENVLDDKELVSELNKTLKKELKFFKDNSEVASGANPNIKKDKLYIEALSLYSDLIKHFSSRSFIKTTDKKSLLKEFEDKYTAVTKSLDDIDNVATIMNDIKISIPISKEPKVWLKKFIEDLHGDIKEALKVRGDFKKKDIERLQEMEKDLALKYQTYENSLKEGKSKAGYNKFISELPAKISAFESSLKDQEGIEGYLKSAGMVKNLDMTDIQFLNQSIKSAYDDVMKYLKDDKYASDKDSLEKYRLDLQTLYAESSTVIKEIKSKESLKNGPYAVIDKAHELSITVDAVLDQLKPGKRLQDILKDNGYAIKIKDIDKLINNIKSAIRDLGNVKTSEKENVANNEVNASILNVLKTHDVVIAEPSNGKTPKEFLTEKEAIEALNFIANKAVTYNLDIQDILKAKGITVPKGTSYISHMKSLVDSSYSELLKLQQSEEFANLDDDYKKRLKVVMGYFEETSKYLSKYIEDMDKYDKALSEAVVVATKMISDFSKSVSNAVNTGYDATKKLMNKKIGIDK